MEILGIGGFEIALVIIIALIVAGPARMAVWARTLGRWVAKMRQLWSVTATQLQRELDDAGVDFQVPRDIPTRKALVDQLSRSNAVRDLSKPVEEIQAALKEGQGALKEAQSGLREVGDGLKISGSRPPIKPAPYKPNPSPKAAEPVISEGFGTWASEPRPAAPSSDLGTWSAPAEIAETKEEASL